MVTMPALDGVDLQHRYIELGEGVTIHVADAGPAAGPNGAQFFIDGFSGGQKTKDDGELSEAAVHGGLQMLLARVHAFH